MAGRPWDVCHRPAHPLRPGRPAAGPAARLTWSDALGTSQGDRPPVVLTTHEGMAVEHRERLVDAPPDAVATVFMGIGGSRGWLYWDSAWRLRGFLDRVLGGVGRRRGRRDPDELRVGDALDFWGVEAVEAGRMLRLRAEMKVPGRAWLQFEAVAEGEGEREGGGGGAGGGEGTRLTQTAFFAPKGLLGWLYWYALYPAHAFIFSGLIRRIGERASGRSIPS